MLRRDDVKDAFARHNVVVLKADWTNRDERITRALESLGRSGVPVYAVHAPVKAAAATSNPQLLPEILTFDAIRRALDQI